MKLYMFKCITIRFSDSCAAVDLKCMSTVANLKRGRRLHPETQVTITTQGCRLGTFTRTKKVHSDMTIYMLYKNWGLNGCKKQEANNTQVKVIKTNRQKVKQKTRCYRKPSIKVNPETHYKRHMGQKTHIKHEGRKKGNTIQYKYNNTVQHIITSCY